MSKSGDQSFANELRAEIEKEKAKILHDAQKIENALKVRELEKRRSRNTTPTK